MKKKKIYNSKTIRISLGDYALISVVSQRVGVTFAEALHKIITKQSPEPKPEPKPEPTRIPVPALQFTRAIEPIQVTRGIEPIRVTKGRTPIQFTGNGV